MKWLSLDLETSGTLPEYALQPWRVRQKKAWITTCAYTVRNGADFASRGKIYPSCADLRRILERAHEAGFTIVGWNVTFDIAWLLAYGLGDIVFKLRWLDGMRLWRHYHMEPEYDMDRSKKKSYGLKTCVAEILPDLAGYENGIDFQTDERPHSAEALKRLLAYNKTDTLVTYMLAGHWWGLLTKRQRCCAGLEAAALPFVAQANLEGVRVDRARLKDLDDELVAIAAQCAKELESDGVTPAVIRSPVQLRKLLYDDWKLLPPDPRDVRLTPKGDMSTDKAALHELALLDPRARRVRDYREALNLRSKFIGSLFKSAAYNDEHDRTHPEAILFGTSTGRMTYASSQGKGAK